jgi:hypothetical protein
MSRAMLAIIGVVAAGLSALVLPAVEAGSRQFSTCVTCRLGRMDHTYLGLRWSGYSETTCSRWYAAQVGAKHAHAWEPYPCRRLTNLLGRGVGFACRRRTCPIWSLSPDSQLAFYQHAEDRPRAKALLLSLRDPEVDEPRPEGGGDLIIRAIAAWEVAGYPGTWEGWWGRWCEDHAEQRE